MTRSLTFAIFALVLAARGAGAMYSAGGPVITLDPSSFRAQVTGDGVWLIEFFAPWCGHCKALKPEWEKTAEVLKGVVTVAAVDASAHESLGVEYGVKGFPSIKLLTVQNSKIKVTDYHGGRTAQELAKFAMDGVTKMIAARMGLGSGSKGSSQQNSGGGTSEFYAGTDVVDLDSGNFEELVVDSEELWLVEFYAPWCGHCKALKPEWIDAASQLRGMVKVGAVNCDDEDEVCARYGVRGFPTIKSFGADKYSPEDFQPERNSAAIVEYAMSLWQKTAPPAKVEELIDNEVFVNECAGHEGDEALDLEAILPKTLCFVAFLPHILDSMADGRNAYLDTLRVAAEKFKGRPFSFLWAEGGKQPELEANFGVGGYGYPAVVALSPSKGVYATMKSSLEKEHLTKWIDRIRQGGETVLPLVGELAELTTATAWDGLDGVMEEEEEFDLSELDDE